MNLKELRIQVALGLLWKYKVIVYTDCYYSIQDINSPDQSNYTRIIHYLTYVYAEDHISYIS